LRRAPTPDYPSSHFDKRPAPHNHDEETIRAGYAVFDLLQVTDSAKMDEYRQKVGATIDKHGGRVVVAGGKFEVVEGSAKPTFPVILEFPSLEAAKGWYDSEEYRPLKALRLAAARTNGVLVQGV
jgi:uncharacterized protein (DUF1330 family)